MARKKVIAETNLFYLSGQEDSFDPYEWFGGLPEHIQEKNEAPYILAIKIKNKEDLDKFADIIGQMNIKNDTKRNVRSIWYPELIQGERGANMDFCWIDENDMGEQ